MYSMSACGQGGVPTLSPDKTSDKGMFMEDIDWTWLMLVLKITTFAHMSFPTVIYINCECLEFCSVVPAKFQDQDTYM